MVNYKCNRCNKIYDHKNYKILVRDIFKQINNELSICDIVNVCIPYFDYHHFLLTLKEKSTSIPNSLFLLPEALK